MKKLTSNKFVIKYGAMVVACILYAFSVAVFTAPNKIVAGGMTGIGTMLNALFGWNIGVMTTVLNIPILLFALKKQGWRFVLDSFITIAVLSLFTDLFSMYTPDSCRVSPSVFFSDTKFQAAAPNSSADSSVKQPANSVCSCLSGSLIP